MNMMMSFKSKNIGDTRGNQSELQVFGVLTYGVRVGVTLIIILFAKMTTITSQLNIVCFISTRATVWACWRICGT